MKYQFVLVPLTLIVLFATLTAATNCGPSGPPPPTNVKFSTTPEVYVCNGSAVATAQLVLNNFGSMSTTVTGNSPPNFNFGPSVQRPSSNTFTRSGSLICVPAQVPTNDSYNVTVWYSEGGTGPCPGPGGGNCFKWFRQEPLPKGFVPDCSHTIPVNMVPTSGFVGACI